MKPANDISTYIHNIFFFLLRHETGDWHLTLLRNFCVRVCVCVRVCIYINPENSCSNKKTWKLGKKNSYRLCSLALLGEGWLSNFFFHFCHFFFHFCLRSLDLHRDMCMCVYVYVCVYMCMYVCICVCMCVYVYISQGNVYVYIHIHIHIHTHMYVRLCVCACERVDTYTKETLR